jgi:hypothetical protein
MFTNVLASRDGVSAASRYCRLIQFARSESGKPKVLMTGVTPEDAATGARQVQLVPVSRQSGGP